MFPAPSNKPNLNQADFDQLTDEGVRVLYEKALQCPCKTHNQNAVPNCQNCGGQGWIFVNPIQTMMVMQRMPAKINLENFTFTNKGSVKFTCKDNLKLTYMDRLTRIDAESTYTQVLEFKLKGTTWFSRSVYNPKLIEYIGFFDAVDSSLRQILPNQYTVDRNFIKLNAGVTLPITTAVTATIRYIHSPVYHVQELEREAMDNWNIQTSGVTLQKMPITGTADKAEYALDQTNLTGVGIIKNSYQEGCKDPSKPC